MKYVGYKQGGPFHHEITLEHHGVRATGIGRTADLARDDARLQLGLAVLTEPAEPAASAPLEEPAPTPARARRRARTDGNGGGWGRAI